MGVHTYAHMHTCVCVQLFTAPWTAARQAPLSVGILQARILEWAAIPFSRGFSQPRDPPWVSCISGRFFTTEPLQCLLQTSPRIISSATWGQESTRRENNIQKSHCYQPYFLFFQILPAHSERQCLLNAAPSHSCLPAPVSRDRPLLPIRSALSSSSSLSVSIVFGFNFLFLVFSKG